MNTDQTRTSDCWGGHGLARIFTDKYLLSREATAPSKPRARRREQRERRRSPGYTNYMFFLPSPQTCFGERGRG